MTVCGLCEGLCVACVRVCVWVTVCGLFECLCVSGEESSG